MGIGIGTKISCDEFRRREAFFFKERYRDHWPLEQMRLKKVITRLKELDARAVVEVVGFGANTDELIEKHPDVSGAPDLRLVEGCGQTEVLRVEVSGTKNRRGNSFWVRPDKIDFGRNNLDVDYFIILHYEQPEEEFVYIRPRVDTEYEVHEEVISGVRERFVIFKREDDEVISEADFKCYLNQKFDEFL